MKPTSWPTYKPTTDHPTKSPSEKPTSWPTIRHTPRPTKAEQTPKPTVWKTPKPTWAKQTPKPTKEETTPKPTVWKSQQYSLNDEEEEGQLQSFNNCPCFEDGRCVDKKRDWLGVPYCPSVCIGSFEDFLAGRNGTC